MKLIRTFLMLVLFSTPSFSLAQGVDGNIILDPPNPTPYSNVTLTFTSYSFNVGTAMITWTSGNKTLASGVGKKQIVVRTGAAGEQISINLSAKTANGTSFEATVALVPESVSLVYETPESFVPPFYEGRSLAAEGATVRVTALPSMSEQGQKVPASELSYSWYINDEYSDALSGAGNQSARVPLDFLREATNVRVLVTAPYGATAENTIDIYPHAIIPAVYTYDAALGTNFTTLISRRFETTKDFTLSLVPYFFSARGPLEQTANYIWLLDDLPITPLDGTTLSLAPKKDSYGSRTLSISMTNNIRRLQEGKIDLDLVFDTRK